MDKKKLIQEIQRQLEHDLIGLKAAAAQSFDAATNDESRPENQYDTRALESSYLAGAQAKRVVDVEASIKVLNFLKVESFDDETPIGPTALVTVELNGRENTLLLVPTAGGVTVTVDGRAIQLITPKSPVGEALLGLTVGDVAIVEKGPQTLEYEILSVE